VLSTAAQGRFAAEFATFLVAAAGLAVVGLRAELLSRVDWARGAMAIGFAAVGTSAFLQGSGIVANRTDVLTAIVMGAGLVAVAAGTMRWTGGVLAQRLLLSGLFLMAVALALNLQTITAADTVLGGGAALAGVALLEASRHSIAARVAASAAATLLVVVLVLSVSLSTVLGSTFDQDQGRQLVERGATETGLVQAAGSTNALLIARTASLILSASNTGSSELLALENTPHPQIDPKLSTILGFIRPSLYPQVSLIYVSAGGQVLGLSLFGNLDQATLTGVVGSAPVQQVIGHGTITHDSERGSVDVVDNLAVAVGIEPVAVLNPNTGVPDYPGALVAVEPLDTSYLAARLSSRDQTDQISLVLATRNTVLAAAGPGIDHATILRLAANALNGAAALNGQHVGADFFSATVVTAQDGRAVMALISAKPTTVVSQTRDKLFRTLFEIALGGTLLALLLAAVVGERIGAGLRTLTEAAQQIQRGELTARTNVRTDDEVGVLGKAFDSMAESISEQTTALQQAADDETALRNQLEAVVAGMGEALVAIDAEGRVTLVNRAAEELLDVDGVAAVGEWVDDVIVAAAEDGGNLPSRLRKPSASRWATQITLIPDQGPGIPVALTAGALRGPGGGVVGAVFVLRDLRPEREVERMKSEFLSRIGHELRTPLTAILGYADILRRRKVTAARAREFHDEIFASGQRLSRIVQMLEFSAAAEAGRSLMRAEMTSVRSVVDSVVNEWTTRVNGNHAISRKVARGLPEIVADRRWLELSLNELVDNAVKFSPEGGRIGVTATPAETDDGRAAVAISVVDQGVGMTPADAERVFDDFTQGDASDTRRFGGLGLGLSLVKRVAEAHGGTVTCTSTPRKGSKFSIVVPV
jgi:signal transduction histidine kinase/HAMP domain-containing protein